MASFGVGGFGLNINAIKSPLLRGISTLCFFVLCEIFLLFLLMVKDVIWYIDPIYYGFIQIIPAILFKSAIKDFLALRDKSPEDKSSLFEWIYVLLTFIGFFSIVGSMILKSGATIEINYRGLFSSVVTFLLTLVISPSVKKSFIFINRSIATKYPSNLQAFIVRGVEVVLLIVIVFAALQGAIILGILGIPFIIFFLFLRINPKTTYAIKDRNITFAVPVGIRGTKQITVSIDEILEYKVLNKEEIAALMQTDRFQNAIRHPQSWTDWYYGKILRPPIYNATAGDTKNLYVKGEDFEYIFGLTDADELKNKIDLLKSESPIVSNSILS